MPMPRLSPSMQTGKLDRWLVAEGDEVSPPLLSNRQLPAHPPVSYTHLTLPTTPYV